MEILVVETHSFIDVITNSSTELFVCDKDKSVEIVKEILLEILEGYKISMSQPDLEFDNIFGRIEVSDGNWTNYDYYGTGSIKEGDILIYSADDNSIPYAMWEIIEERLECKERIHLG